MSIAFVIGILLSNFVKISLNFYLIFAVLGIGLMLFFAMKKSAKFRYRFDWIFGLGFLLMIMCVGVLCSVQNTENQRFKFANEKGVFLITLTDFPTEKTKSALVYAELKSFSDSAKTENCTGKIVLYLQKDSNALNLKTGDKLLISTLLSMPETKGNPDEFDYSKYLKRKNIVATGYVSTDCWQKIGSEKGFSLFRLAQRCRMQLLDIYRDMNISGDEFGIVAALTLGYKDALSPELRDSFSTTGASHVLAVSGLHVGIIFMIINYLLVFLNKDKKKKRWKSLIVIAFLWFYAFITGLSPSVCRAALMFSLMAFGNVISRKSYTYNTIFASFFILLLINPNWLFDVGFQLSYAAVLAIVYFQPKIRKLLIFKSKPMIWLWDLTSVSIAAQLGTAPIALYYFHQFPNYFLLSNFIVIPAASFIIYAAIFLFAVHKIPIISVLASFLLELIVKIMYACIKFIENLPNALTFSWLNGWQTLIFFGIIFAVGFLFYKINFKAVLYTLVFSILLIFTILIYNIDNQGFNQLTIFNDNKGISVNIAQKANNVVFTTSQENTERYADGFWLHHDCKKPDYQLLDSANSIQPFVFNNQKFLILYDDYFYKKVSEKPLEVDYLLVSRNIFPKPELFEQYFSPKTLIINADVYAKNAQKFEQIAQNLNIKTCSISKNGAFVLRKQ
ncbi:MAG: ComEC family competence protein [Prevotellaceae bacterium]|nr:ComEC family competence protein [Prevotellaceae bacterium]